MAFLWFKNDVSHWERKRVQLEIQQMLNATPVQKRGKNVRATLEISLDKRPRNEAQAVFRGALREIAGLGRDAFDTRLVSTGISHCGQQRARRLADHDVAIGIDHDRVEVRGESEENHDSRTVGAL